jgi:hypothetical protein
MKPDNQLKKIPVGGGPPVALATVDSFGVFGWGVDHRNRNRPAADCGIRHGSVPSLRKRRFRPATALHCQCSRHSAVENLRILGDPIGYKIDCSRLGAI